MMKRITTMIKQHMANNRTDWIALMTQGYGVTYSNLWKLLGYNNQKDYEEDLNKSLQALPHAPTIKTLP